MHRALSGKPLSLRAGICSQVTDQTKLEVEEAAREAGVSLAEWLRQAIAEKLARGV
jgi:hypothetical protein